MLLTAFLFQEGVRVSEFGDMWLRLQWVAPVLKNREVTAYEVQMCEPTGPRQNSVAIFKKSASSQLIADDGSTARQIQSAASGYEFYTVDDSVTENHTIIRNLKPGIRYQFRVRPQIDNIWCGMNLIQISDIVAVPASSPEPPAEVVICSMVPTTYKRPSTGTAVSALPVNDCYTSEDNIRLADTGYSLYYNEEMKIPAITHNSMLISWKNGNPNGSPILESAIEMARVRDYNPADTVLGLNSSGKLIPDQLSGSQNTLSPYFDSVISGIESDIRIDVSAVLNWKDITRSGKYISSTSFRAVDLLPGCGYIFRIRQRNNIGWSAWSLASDMAITLASAPPCAPVAVEVSSFHAVLKWADMESEFNYTILDYELQVALLPAGKLVDQNSKDHDDSNWDVPLEWFIPEARRHDLKNNLSAGSSSVRDISTDSKYNVDNFECRSVFVDKLSPMSIYVARVKIRTVTGWSAWSGIGEPFRTLSPP